MPLALGTWPTAAEVAASLSDTFGPPPMPPALVAWMDPISAELKSRMAMRFEALGARVEVSERTLAHGGN